MSFVAATPEFMTSAAADLATVGSNLNAAAAAASAPTSSIAAAGADEISSAVTALFNAEGQAFQALEAQAAALRRQFVARLQAASAAYAFAESQGALPLVGALNAGEALLGLPSYNNPFINSDGPLPNPIFPGNTG